MLEHVYDIESVRTFLRERGARRLEDGDPALPVALRDCAGEHWLLPVGWRHAASIVVRFGETYPDDPPTLFITASADESELLPHVADSGDICTIVRTNVVNPHRPLELLQICLNSAKETLDREWTDAEMALHVNEELTAYWTHSAVETLLYSRADFEVGPLEVAKWKTNAKYSHAAPATESRLTAPYQLALAAELGEDETVSFLRMRGPYLSASHPFRAALTAFAESVCSRTKQLRAFDLFLFLVVKHSGGECVLAGRLRQSIKAKGKSATELACAIAGALSTKGLEPWNAEDISTPRLLRRTMGPFFDSGILERRVAIIGCGSLGAMVADGLARSGLRRFLLCDTDSFKPENLLRHLLPADYLGFGKAKGLEHFLLKRVPDAQIELIWQDIRTNASIAKLAAFAPDLVLFATGDTNTDLTMSRLLPLAHEGALAFAWADANLAAGHIVYQPAGADSQLIDLHEETTAAYVYSLADEAPELREAGCQSSYSPYSGLEMAHFANVVAMKLLDWLSEVPSESQVLRMLPREAWDRLL